MSATTAVCIRFYMIWGVAEYGLDRKCDREDRVAVLAPCRAWLCNVPCDTPIPAA
jgi:hypothetical protein